MLTITDHRRDKLGLKYIYPVLSRRSGGLSIGINLNVNNACNWACIYCQVPDLIRGNPPPVDSDELSRELRYVLTDVIGGDFYVREAIPDEYRSIQDIAISGNGEPTLVRDFEHIIDMTGVIMDEFGLRGNINLVLITNGSMINKSSVKAGLEKISNLGGEVWFKVDSVTPAGMSRINDVRGSEASILKRLATSSALCSTWIQTCVFGYDNKPPEETELSAYLNFLDAIKSRQIPVEGVLLYGLARSSMQPGADRLTRLPEQWLQQFALRINHYDMDVNIFP